MPDQAPDGDEEVLDGSDLEFVEEDTDAGPVDPLAPGDTDPAPGVAAGQGVPQQAHGYPQQQQPGGYPQQQQPGYPQQQPGGYPPQQPGGYPQQQQQQQPGYPQQQAPAPTAATLPPDSLQYSPQQGYEPAPAQAPAHPAAAQPAPAQPAAPQQPPVHKEEYPTNQQDQRAIQAAIDGTPYTSGPKMLIIGGNNRGREFPLNTGGDTTIGRGVDNHIILADIAVSRKHTLICYEGGQFVVRDLGSGNGTLVNGRRVDSHHLRDGDQVEMGNTLLRYVNPVAAAPASAGQAAAAASAPISQQSTDHVPMPSQPGAAAPAHAPAPAHPSGQMATPSAPPMTAPAKLKDPAARRKKLLIFGAIGLIVFFGAMIGIKAVIGSKKAATAAKKGPAPDQVAAQEFQEGTTQFRAKNWAKARTHFLKVLKLAPKFEDAQRYADRAGTELKAQEALQAAEGSLKAKDYKASRVSLSKVPSTSTYAADARKLKQKVDDGQLTDLIQQAKKHKEAGEIKEGMTKISQARDLAPTNQAVKDLYDELSGMEPAEENGATKVAAAARKPSGGSSRPRSRPSGGSSRPRNKPSGGSAYQRPSPGPKVRAIKVGSGAKAALGHYKNKEWAKAFQSIKSYASAQSGSRKKKAERLADAIRKVGQNWIRASKAGSATQALKYYQQAMIYDKKVKRGGMHQSALKELCFKQARKEAATALARGKYTTAFAAYKLARRFGKEDASLRKVASGLEKKAQALFTKGYTKRSTNIAYARKCWQQVLKMVPPSSHAYQKAYKWLNESTPSYEDEDED